MERFKKKDDWFRSIAEAAKNNAQGPQGTAVIVLMEMAWQLKTLNDRLAQIEAAIKTVGR